MSQTDFKKLIADATERNVASAKLKWSTPIQATLVSTGYKAGAALPNELLLKAIEALEFTLDRTEESENIAVWTRIDKTLDTIRTRLMEAK